jgi:hypothetical protein
MLSTENDLRKRVPYTNGYSDLAFYIGWVNRLDTNGIVPSAARFIKMLIIVCKGYYQHYINLELFLFRGMPQHLTEDL